jgi:hypothetical protein
VKFANPETRNRPRACILTGQALGRGHLDVVVPLPYAPPTILVAPGQRQGLSLAAGQRITAVLSRRSDGTGLAPAE